MLQFRVHGCQDLFVPGFKGMGRGTNLWKTTCFELFVADNEGRYREFNFSPSQQWAAYEFSGYRNLVGDFEMPDPPAIKAERGPSLFVQTVFVSPTILRGGLNMGLAAVIMEEDRRPSYWALRHDGMKPDFHAPACFVAPIPAAHGE